MAKEKDLLSSLVQVYESGGLHRRDFLKVAAAAGIVTAATRELLAMPGHCRACHSGPIVVPGFELEAATKELIDRAHALGIELIFDRSPRCEYSKNGQGGAAGLCCFRCQMGPCSLGEASGQEYGVCGATRDVVTARELVRRVAGGASAHVEHARAAAKTLRGVALGDLDAYTISDPAKLDAIFLGLGFGCNPDDDDDDDRDDDRDDDGRKGRRRGRIYRRALKVANRSLRDLAKDEGTPAWLEYKANSERKTTWGNLGILPTGAGAEISEAQHRTTMGVDADMVHLATDALKLGLVDGYCGLHMATNLQDVLFGTPRLVQAKASLSVIERDQVNLIVHGHEPILSEKIVEAADTYNSNNPALRLNVVGMCCTGNEVLMRRGVNQAGSMVQQELAIATGAVEVMVVDVQCIIPNVQRVASQFHTQVVTTNPHAKITGATHIAFEPENAAATAQEIVDMAVANYANRDHSKVSIPLVPPKDIMVGFSVEQIIDALAAVNPSDPLKPLIDNIVANNIRGIVAIVGCVSPENPFGYNHVTLTRKLLAENILVVGTGCWGHVAGQYGLLTPDPAYPGVGAGLAAVLHAVAQANGLEALPACWHMGSCVDNSRIEDVVNAVAAYLGVAIHQLPIAASAPENITEKAVSIGTWAVNLGILTHIGTDPYVNGSANLSGLLTSGVEGLTGGKFLVQVHPKWAARKIINAINDKRAALGLPV